MHSLQEYFLKFHREIRLENAGQYKKLRQRRDHALEMLRQGLKKQFLGIQKIPTFEFFNTGSYEMGTGIHPLSNQDYDIDVGIVFNMMKGEYDPMEVKKWVYHSLSVLKQQEQAEIEVMRPCIRIQYKKNKKKQFHIDLAVYAKGDSTPGIGNPTQSLFLAKGHLNSSDGNKDWEKTQPFYFQNEVKNRYQDPKTLEQFRRVICFMKRWKDIRFPSREENAAPIGIAITVAMMKWLQLDQKGFVDNDLKALTRFTQVLLQQFNPNLVIPFPCEPRNNLMEKMGSSQMGEFKKKLGKLAESLARAQQVSQNPKEGCAILGEEFGEGFNF